MSKIGTEEVKRLARLARIQLSPHEEAGLAVELGKIVEFVEQLSKVDTTHIEPTNQVTGLADVWRSDEIKTSKVGRHELLSNAPMTKDGYIKVKRVL